MKKRLLIVLFLFVFSFTLVSATCDLGVSLINQDPYPAIPNHEVELVFQVTGVENDDCRNVAFEVIEKFPFSIIEGELVRTLKENTYTSSYKREWMIPYDLFVDPNALNGESELITKYYAGTEDKITTLKFNISIEDSRAEFETYIKDYSYSTKELTLEILNIADVDVEALTIEIQKQKNIDVRGTNRVIVGDLDSNEYSSADFKADIRDGEITIKISYTDQVGIRREVDQNVLFESSYFINEETKKTSTWNYILVIIILGLLIWWWIRRKNKKKKEHHMRRRGSARF